MDRRQYLAFIGGGSAGGVFRLPLSSTLDRDAPATADDDDADQPVSDRDTVTITVELRDDA